MLSEDKSREVEVNPLYHGGSSARVSQQELHGSTDDKNDEMNMDVGEMPLSAQYSGWHTLILAQYSGAIANLAAVEAN